MSKELVIDVTSSEIVIALLENKQLVELTKEKNNIRFSVGDIYIGVVKKIMSGLNATFIDIGYKKDAFLHYLDLGPQFNSSYKYLKMATSHRSIVPTFEDFKLLDDIDKNGKISNLLATGQNVLVQIVKEPISTKGPRLTSEISIAGRNLVLIPFSNKISVSQKISSPEEKLRLKNLIQSIKPNNYGVIVRTVAETKKVADLDIELRELKHKWESSLITLKEAAPPQLIIGEINRITAILRDILNSSFNNIYINDENIYNEIKEYVKNIAPDKVKILKLFNGKTPIFQHFAIDKQIKSLFGKIVTLKNGSYLIIQHTEALHVIDVNSGNKTASENNQDINALEVNLAASEEIARQLRLRDIGGIIIIDFIDMHSSEHKIALFEKMKAVMSEDRAKHNILPLSKFGLMQITRQRVRPETNISITEKCPSCGGKGEISPSIIFDDQIENNLEIICSKTSNKIIKLYTHPFITAYLKQGIFSKRLKWSIKYNKIVKILSDTSYNMFEFHFFDRHDEEIL